jgi:hypothetical protein
MSTPLKAIKEKCLDCCCGQANEVKQCPIHDCSLYPYRFGRGQRRDLTEEQRKAMTAHLNAHRFTSKTRHYSAGKSI